jgi:uncharacterized protein involved in exopolysaccharide biosynthesis
MNGPVDRDLGLSDVMRFYWRHRLVVVIVALAFAILAGIWVFRAKPTFRAETVVTMAREDAMERNSMLGSELGGIASLAGFELSRGTGQEMEASAILESHYLAEEFIRRNDLLPALLAHSSKPPTLWLGVKTFKEGVLSIRKDQRKGITTLGIEWTDAAVAARWANDYVSLANELIRSRTIGESTRNIAYLNEQLAKTTDVELRRAIYNLIEGQTKTLMLANGRAQYAFEVVDPAVAPELKVGPHRLMTMLIAFILGAGAAGVGAFVWESFGWRKGRTAQAQGAVG